jgi:hypothetical protein
MLAERWDRVIFAADLNRPMLETGLQLRSGDAKERVRGFQGSAFAIPFRSNTVEAVVCIRLLHHFPQRTDRVRLLREMGRVASRAIIVTLWIDGNWKGNRLLRRDAEAGIGPSRDRFAVRRRDIEAEIHEAGLAIHARVDFLKFYSMWAAYVLRKN